MEASKKDRNITPNLKSWRDSVTPNLCKLEEDISRSIL